MQWLNVFVGLPFRDKGRDYEGIDCWGLVYLVYRDIYGISLPLYQGYESAHKSRQVMRIIEEGKSDWTEIPKKEAKLGDVALFRLKSIPSHVGVFIDNHRFVHCTKKADCAIEKFNRLIWKNRLVGIFRYDK